MVKEFHNLTALSLVLVIAAVMGLGLISLGNRQQVTADVVYEPSSLDICASEYRGHMRYCEEAFDSYFDINICKAIAEKECLFCAVAAGTRDDGFIQETCPIE